MENPLGMWNSCSSLFLQTIGAHVYLGELHIRAWQCITSCNPYFLQPALPLRDLHCYLFIAHLEWQVILRCIIINGPPSKVKGTAWNTNMLHYMCMQTLITVNGPPSKVKMNCMKFKHGILRDHATFRPTTISVKRYPNEVSNTRLPTHTTCGRLNVMDSLYDNMNPIGYSRKLCNPKSVIC